jgi:hypothetical protein
VEICFLFISVRSLSADLSDCWTERLPAEGFYPHWLNPTRQAASQELSLHRKTRPNKRQNRLLFAA